MHEVSANFCKVIDPMTNKLNRESITIEWSFSPPEVFSPYAACQQNQLLVLLLPINTLSV
jgi:hypothetical protein